MGMDVYGQNPTSKNGEYFRNNVWYWRPLWDYCLARYPKIAGKVKTGHYNDGDGLGAEDALLMGLCIFKDIESGYAKEYEVAYTKAVLDMPTETCTYCNGTGVRNDTAAKELQSVSVGSYDIDDDTGTMYCHLCNGQGLVPNYANNYPFEVSNLEAFANFLVNSGGFKIC